MKPIQAVKFVVSKTFQASKKQLILYCLLTFFVSFTTLGNMFIFKEIIDVAGGLPSIFGLGIISLIVVRLIYEIISKIITRYSEYIWNIIDLKLTIFNTGDFVDKLETLDLANFENSKTFDKIWRSFNRIPWQIRAYLESTIQFLAQIVALSASIVIFFLASPIIALFIVVSNIIPVIVRAKLGEQSFNIYKADSETKRKFEYSSTLVTNREMLVEIKQYQGFPFIKKIIMSLYKTFASKQEILFSRSWKYLALVEMLPTIAIFVFLLNLANRLSSNDITIGTFVFLFTNIFIFFSALSQLTMYLGRLITDSPFIHDAIDFYNVTPTIIFPKLGEIEKDQLAEKLKKPKISIRNLSFRYQNSQINALSNINLTIPYGQNLALIGKNGAGKTTLVKLLLRVYDPTEGDIFINDINLKDIPESVLFVLYSTLFQSFGKFYLTIKENMELAAGKSLPNEEYEKALKLSNAWNYIKDFPKGLNQQLGANYTDGTDLSGGQWQLLAISRALVRKTPVLILDEPTSAVDAKSETEIFDRLNKETKNSTLIFISHRFSTIKDAQRIVVLDKGKVTEDGDHASLIKKGGQYAKLFTIQAQRYLRDETNGNSS